MSEKQKKLIFVSLLAIAIIFVSILLFYFVINDIENLNKPVMYILFLGILISGFFVFDVALHEYYEFPTTKIHFEILLILFISFLFTSFIGVLIESVLNSSTDYYILAAIMIITVIFSVILRRRPVALSDEQSEE